MTLQERLETIRSSPVPKDEESAKFKILAPILQSLGWDPYGPEVLYEHPVGGKGGGGRVDIALRSSVRVVALIEAKAPRSDLSNHVTQVLGYAFHEGVDICVLTTGFEWWLYLPREAGRPSERRFAVLKVTDDPVEQLLEDFNAFLSKEMLVNGQAERRAKAVRKAGLEAAQLNKEIPGIWKRMLQEPDEELVELLGKRVYEKLNVRPTRAQVAAALGGSPIPSAAVRTSSSDSPSPPTEEKSQGKRKTPRPSVKPTAMVLWGKRYEVTSSRAVLLAVADALHEQHGDEFDGILQVRGRKLPTAARDPSTLGTTEYREIKSSGIYISVAMDAAGAVRRAKYYLKHFDHDATDLEVLYDQDPAE